MTGADAGQIIPPTIPIRMTRAEAEALECNRCGDCCGSRGAVTQWPSGRVRWHWGAIEPDQFAGLNGGVPLIIPLVEATPDYYEDDPAPLAYSIRGDEWDGWLMSSAFRCAQFSRDDDGLGVCGLYDEPRPPACGGFPYDHMGDPKRFAEDIAKFPRCTWYGIEIIDG